MALNGGLMGTGFLFQGKDGGLGKMMRHMSSGMMGFAGHTRSATASLKLMGQGFAAFTAGAKLLSGAFSAAKGFSEFEFKMASVSGITQATTRELKLLENAAISAGIATQFSPLEAAEGLEVLGATGFDAADSMTVLRSSLDLAAGSMGQLGVADAAAIASASLKAYGRDVGEAALMTDKLLRVTQLTNFQTRDMIGAFPKLMGKGSPFRQSFDDMLIAMGLMRNVGIDAFTAQTALSAAFMRLGSERRVQDAIKPFAKVFDEETKQMRPMMDIILDLAEVTKDWTDEKRQSLEATLAGRRGILSFSGVTRAVTKAILANREAVKLALVVIILNQRRGVFFIHLEAMAYDFFGFVVAHDQLAAAFVADALDFGRHELHVVNRLAFRIRAGAPRKNAVENDLLGHVDRHHAGQRDIQLVQNLAQPFGLRNRARETVEDEALLGVAFGQASLHHVQNQLVRHEAAFIHKLFRLQTQLGARRDVAA